MARELGLVEQTLRNWVKAAWLDGQRRSYPLPVLCGTIDVSISGYRAWKRGGRWGNS